MTQNGLDVFLQKIPKKIIGKKIGVLCHAASVTTAYTHILDEFAGSSELILGAVFGPQHGLFGQTQDNMVEWEGGYNHPAYKAPVYSLYGETRKPSKKMLDGLDMFLIDLQDVGARPYTYIWTVKLCMEACMEQDIPVCLLDRPNPIAALPLDGPLLNEEYFSFVGGAGIPLCHRMTIGEMAIYLKQKFFPSLTLEIVWMKDWWRDSLFYETGLPWVMPSPNMPSLQTALVYPGMVLFEATNISEGRGTTLPFELFGAPYIERDSFKRNLSANNIPGCLFREHNFIPTFQKWQDTCCYGMQVHVTDPRIYQPVYTSVSILKAIIQTSGENTFVFKDPPYEYEYEKMPFDILAGDAHLREFLLAGRNVKELLEKWHEEHNIFLRLFADIAYYPEKKR